MRRLCLGASLLLLVVATGCSSNNEGKIEGTKWSSNAMMVDGQQVPAGVLLLEFQEDGTLIYRDPEETLTGTYKLGMGDTVILKFDEKVEGYKEHHQKIQINGKEMKLIDSDGFTVKLTKVE